MNIIYMNDIIKNLPTSNDEAVIYLYNKIDDITTIFGDYLNNPTKIIDYKKNYAEELYNTYINSKQDNFTIVSIVRLTILKLCNAYKNQSLLEKEEIANAKTNKIYTVIITNDNLKIKLYILYLLVYGLEAKIRYLYSSQKVSHCGIDYEFHNRQIALMQVSYETWSSHDVSTISYIWLTNPDEFDDKQRDILFKYMMRNKYIKRIIHGADALDVPYMYNILFNKDNNKMKDFMSNVIDTRFLCEYTVASEGIEKKKCSIYNTLRSNGVLDDVKYDYLINTEDNMGPKQDIVWNIHKMSSHHIKYALYDVLFLKRLVESIIITAQTKNPFIVPSFEYISYLTGFNYIEKLEISHITKDIKAIVDPMNNYRIQVPSGNPSLMDIYTKVITGMRVNSIGLDVDSLFGVNYFRTEIKILLKFLVYCVVAQHNKIWKTRTFYLHYNLNPKLENLYTQLKDVYPQILSLMTEIQKEIENKFMSLY